MEAGAVHPEVYQQINTLRASLQGEQEAKGDAVSDLTDEQVQRLLGQSSETWQDQSDQLLLALLLRCGLWPQSIIALNRSSINLADGTMTFYQYHAEEQQTLDLDPVTRAAATHYLCIPSPYEALFVGKHQDGTPAPRLTAHTINVRVRALGEKAQIKALSPKRCHAYWEKTFSQTKPSAPFRKRPDIFNRRAFEEVVRQQGVADSMLALTVSESRLVLPLALEFLTQPEIRQAFLHYVQHKLPEYGLQYASCYEETLDLLASWMNGELAAYRISRNEADE